MRLLALLLVMLPALAFGVRGVAGPYRVDVVSDPPVLTTGRATLDVFVTDGSGKPIDGATVRAIAQMPNMAMGEREQSAAPTGVPGHYRFVQSFSMAGGYDARIKVSGPLGSGTASIPLETGKTTMATHTTGGASVLALWPWLLGAALVAFTLVRMRRTGQRLDVRRALNRQTVGALAVLGVVTAVAVYAVNHWRRQGAMTPIEAQVMQMDTPPPEGVAPVTLATVERRPLAATASYSGQAVGFVEQDVNARTSGVIEWMPTYVGSAVRKGQVVARLDTSQLAPQVAGGQAGVESARQGVGVAEADYREAQAMIEQAEAEEGQYGSAVAEAQANLDSARSDREAASAAVASAKADVQDAQARVASAEADARYWGEELRREASLFAAGAVSRDEYEREKADAAKSEAAVRQAEEAVRSAQAKARGAAAGVRKADADIAAAARKVEGARSQAMAHHAHVRTARAAAASARQKIGQSAAGVRQAQAGLQGLTAQAGYAELRAEADGVVTQRAVSPGTLVAPGQTILRIAQVAPIRLQANVPTADLDRIKVGGVALVRHRDKGEKPIRVRITSVSPAVDPVSRTGLVEALYDNRDRTFLPGQSVTMELPVGSSSEVAVVPAAAVQTGVADGTAVQADASSTFVWVASPVPGQPDRYTVARRHVTLGDRAADSASVNSGIEAGERVVVDGAEGLSEGETVSAPPTKVAEAVVTITENGFEPASIKLAGGAKRVTFLRKTDATCAKSVVFPKLGITRDLPLNERVTIDLPPSATGTLSYACGMDMLKGSVIVQ